MLTKEECEESLYELSLITAKDTEDGSCLGCSCTSCLPNDECLNGKLIGTFNKLIKEHFELVDKYNELEEQHMKLLSQWGKSDNPPLKFEELHEGMWVWDRRDNKYVHIYMTRIYEYDTGCFFKGQKLLRIYCDSGWYDTEFVENRFYRKQVE